MFAAKILSLIGATASAIGFQKLDQVGDDASLHCIDGNTFCQRTREFKIDQQAQDGADLLYSIDPTTIEVDATSGQINAKLVLGCDQNGFLASELELTIAFYQNGIMRALLDTSDRSRFRISEEDLPVVWDQLSPLSNFDQKYSVGGDSLRVKGITRDDGGDEVIDYYIKVSPFSIIQMINGKISQQTSNSLYFENMSTAPSSRNDATCFDGLRQRAQARSGIDIYQDTTEKKQSVMWGFKIPDDSTTLFGIPEREDTLALKTTTGTDPYQLFATDHLHSPNESGPLYGSIPYVMGLNQATAVSMLWVNSAKTLVDIDRDEQGAEITFSSEANVLELFMLGSGTTTVGQMNRVKNVNKDLATISGFAPMPLLATLGYHFCKWAPVSAQMLMDRNRNFTDYGFPVDYLWSDIEWAQQNDDPQGYEYFKFNPKNFTDAQISQMNTEISDQGRRIVVIVDPHIKATEDYFVYAEGMDLQNQQQPVGNVSNIFVREGSTDVKPFYGDCWPGNSTWIDFLNTNAQDFWGNLFSYDVFKGSNKIYSFWNDMNEPAVFSTDSHTMPMDAIHVKVDGTQRTHLEVHNAYGALHQKSSYRGLLKRDNNQQRPFVLTRSFFIGSQRFGAYWTGDNRSVFEELQGSITMILQLGNAGHPIGGSDVPGFYGSPTDDLFVMFYQVGMWYPFFRAHSQDVYLPFPLHDREPWMQSSRVREAIRDAVNRRYDLIHYIYSTIEQTTRTAEPLMRTMWNEFPEETRFWNVESQFMFGSQILVAPKVTRPEGVYNHMHLQQVTYALPQGATWYNYYSKAAEESTPEGEWVEVALPDLEQAVFVRGGTILPIMLHDNCMALLPCMTNDIRFEIYPDSTGQAQASGTMYFDDGQTLNYQSQTCRYNYSYKLQMFFVEYTEPCTYDGTTPNVYSVAIYGVERAPKYVYAAGYNLDFVYEAYNKSLVVFAAASFMPPIPVNNMAFFFTY